MKTAKRIAPRLLAAATVGLLVACTPGAADQVITDGEPALHPHMEGGDAWTASSPSGVEVSLSLDPLPLRPGPVRLKIALVGPPSEVLPLSLDLVSPEMPMHGIVRYEAQATMPDHYEAVVEIPMEGFWELYVNLDYGADAAVFELDVPPAAGSTGHVHRASTEADFDVTSSSEDAGSDSHAGHDPR